MLERFTVVALPHSCADDAPFHVSLFISPDIDVDRPEATLADCDLFQHWTAALSRARFTLEDQFGAIDCTPMLNAVEDGLWEEVFVPETPVTGYVPPDWNDRPWRTFSPGRTAAIARFLQLAAVLRSGVEPPTHEQLPWWGPELARILGGPGRENPALHQRQDPLTLVGLMEQRLTETFDRAVLEGVPLAELGPRDYFLDRPLPPGADTVLGAALRELHRARRFYEHPEEQGAYRGRPDPDHQEPSPPPKQIPDFHERVSLVNDHGPLQRSLGLVVDLRADPGRLAESEWLCGRILIEEAPDSARTVRVACRKVGTALVTVTREEGGPWINGRLRLGDGDLFDVLDIDPDGSALKAERYLASFPRQVAAGLQGAPVNAATPALRTTGLTVARRHNAGDTAVAMDTQRGVLDSVRNQPPEHPATDVPLLFTEDVMQGVRIDAHDAHTGQWRSLHDVVVTAQVLGGRTLTFDDVAFLEETAPTHAGGASSPIHVHEALFGWDGWSLSAPRPALPVVHVGGEEKVVTDPQPPDDPSSPLLIRRQAAPGSLPRLRFGRQYAFRAWGVDLACNSRPHHRQPVAPPRVEVAEAPGVGALDADDLLAFRLGVTDRLRAGLAGEAQQRAPQRELQVTEARLDEAMPEIRARLQVLRGDGRVRATNDIDHVHSVLRDHLAVDGVTPASAAAVNPEVVATGLGWERGEALGELIAAESQVVTPQTPHLRWHPVPPPAIVPRRAFTEGESTHLLVIRSWVSQDPTTLALTTSDAATYAASRPGRSATCERHLVPPKTSQLDAELHEAFDHAIGSPDATLRNLWLNAAVRESGTLFDLDVPRLDDPSLRDPQTGIALVHGPQTPSAERRTLPLPPGEAPAAGQYVVHDIDVLHTPYLPDVIARGLGFVFPDAGRDRSIIPPFGVEGFTVRYVGTWPEIDGHRLELADAAELDASVTPHLVRVAVPAGTRLRARVSSMLDRADLEVLGPWRQLPDAVRSAPGIADAAARGWLWVLTPTEDLTLVHAVPRPVAVPEPIRLAVHRLADRTEGFLTGGVDLHGPSTDSLIVEARWDEPLDDLSLPAWRMLANQRAIACTTAVEPWEDIAVLMGGHDDVTSVLGDLGRIRAHRAVHQLSDTKHRLVHYRLRATTRFREYFAPDELAAAPVPDDPCLPIDDGRSTVSAEQPIHVLNTGLPAAPLVHQVLPLFRWGEGTEPEQPMARRRVRRSGVRVYLERPWFTTGADEMVGVVLVPVGAQRPTTTAVSQWGSDPFWLGSPIADREALGLTHLLAAAGLGDFHSAAGPAGAPVTLPAGDDPNVAVTVVPYRPEYNEQRRLWYVDIGLTGGFWPFVQVALVRYQPYSVPGRHLSKPTLCEFVQLPPERTASVSRTSEGTVRIVLSGPVGVHDTPRRRAPGGNLDPLQLGAMVAANRVTKAKLQYRDDGETSDLAWVTKDETELAARGFVDGPNGLVWTGELPVPEALPYVRPSTTGMWRVRIEEWETFIGDPMDLGERRSRPTREERLIYADEFELGTEESPTP